MPRLMVGIDPGVDTGFAIWDADAKKLEVVTSHSICEAMLRVHRMQSAGSLHMVVFEDARLRTWFGTKGREALQGAGSIKRDCQVWAEWLGIVGCAYRAISPQAKGAKVNAGLFRAMTGWQDRTNNHGRDAAMLVYGSRGFEF